MKMIGGESPTVSRLYRIPGVDWLLAEQEQFSSTTTLRHADLNGLPQDNTFGPLNTRSLTDVRQRARELTPPARKGKFQAENKPNKKHHKMYRQFAKPPGQTPGEYSEDYPRTTTVDGDDKRYGKLKAPIGDGLFAAYDPLEMKAAKYLIVASSDYLYTPRSLFWPDVIFLTAPKLDWGQAIGMMISVRRVVSMEPQVIVVAGSKDHLQSRGLLTRLTDGSIPSNEVVGEAIMTLLSAMAEVETAAKHRFTQNVVKVVFVLSPGYAALPEPLQFVYTMVTTIAEGRFNVIIPAPNRVVDPDNYYPSRSELPAVWADISNAIQGLKDCSTTRLVLSEVLGLELSNFARLLKLRPGVDDDHLLVQQVADDLWFRQMDHTENEQGRTVRKIMTSAEEDLMAMALRTKPHNNVWLYLSPRLRTLGEDAFEHAPAVIKEIHVYLKNLFDARELAGGMMLKLMQDVNTMALDKFQADVLATRAQCERSNAILGGMGVGWTPSFLSTCYPRVSRNLIASVVKDIRKLSIGLILALYVTFGHENFVKGPANLRLDGLLTLIAMTYGRLGDVLVLLRYPEQLQGPSREFNAQLETASLRKMKDWRTLLLQYLLQQNRSVTGEDKVATDAGEFKQYCGMPLLTDLAVMMRIDLLALIYGLREFVTVVYGPVMSFAFPDVQVKAYRNSVLYVNLVSVVDCSVLNWVEQRELRGLASDDRLFGRVAEQGWVLMDFNNHFKCRMGREDLSHIQFNPKLWNLRPVVKDTGAAMGVPLIPEAYAHAKENQQARLSGSRPLPDQCPRYSPIRRMLLGVTSPITAPRIGAARDAEKRMLKWSEGMEPRFIGWNVAAAHTFDFSFPDAWSRKKIKALPSRRPEVSAEMWNEVYTPTDDLSRLKWSGEAKVVMLEVARESRGGSYITIEDLAPHGEESVEFLVNDELFYHTGDDDGEVDGSLLLMTPSYFMSLTKEASADLPPMDPISQARECRSRDPQRLLHESPRRRKIEESMRVSFLSTLPEEEWERYQSELEGKTGATWIRVNFIERSWDVIRRYGTLSIMKVGLNQTIMREVLQKIVNSMESDVLTESVTEDSADDQQVTKKLPVRRARKGLKRLKGKTGSRAVNPRVVKSKSSTVVASLMSAGRSGESGQGDGATLTGGEKENLIPPMLLAGLTTTAVRSKKTARTLADTKLEMEIISQCGSGGLEDYRPSRTNMAKLKLEGQLDVVEYSRVTVPESVHMGDPAGGYVEMLKARNSARGHLMAWSEKRAMQEYLKELTENSNLNRKEYGTVMSSEANEIGLEKLLEISWRAALHRYFDETMHAPATVAAYLAHPCMRTDLQVRLAWCLMGIKKAEYEASNDSKSREQELELMEALRALISKDDSAIAWAKRKDALCFVRFVVDRIPTPVLGECIKIIRQKGVDCERNFLRALLELYQDMPLTVPNKESNDMESYRKLEEVRRYSNKELKVSRELIEAVKGQKDFATLGKLKSFQYVSGIPGMVYNPFVNEEAREAYFDYEQVIVLNFWVERMKETGMLMVEQPKLGIILVEPSVPELKGQVSFDCGSWDGPLKTSLVTMWELMKPSWCPHPNAGLIWDMTAVITLDLDDDASLHDLAMIHHLLAMRLTKRKSNPSTELSEKGPSSNWLKQGTCLAQHSGMEGHVCNLGHCLITLSEQHRQLARLYFPQRGSIPWSIADRAEDRTLARSSGERNESER